MPALRLAQTPERPLKGVFLSYASDDAPAAARICAALRAAGLEVWFDQSELRGGDAWDAAIRRQIKTCALFIRLRRGGRRTASRARNQSVEYVLELLFGRASVGTI